MRSEVEEINWDLILQLHANCKVARNFFFSDYTCSTFSLLKKKKVQIFAINDLNPNLLDCFLWETNVTENGIILYIFQFFFHLKLYLGYHSIPVGTSLFYFLK